MLRAEFPTKHTDLVTELFSGFGWLIIGVFARKIYHEILKPKFQQIELTKNWYYIITRSLTCSGLIIMTIFGMSFILGINSGILTNPSASYQFIGSALFTTAGILMCFLSNKFLEDSAKKGYRLGPLI